MITSMRSVSNYFTYTILSGKMNKIFIYSLLFLCLLYFSGHYYVMGEGASFISIDYIIDEISYIFAHIGAFITHILFVETEAFIYKTSYETPLLYGTALTDPINLAIVLFFSFLLLKGVFNQFATPSREKEKSLIGGGWRILPFFVMMIGIRIYMRFSYMEQGTIADIPEILSVFNENAFDFL